MESFKLIKIMDEYYCMDDDIRRLLKYIAGEGKNKDREKMLGHRGKGLSSNAEKAAEHIIMTQRAYGKDNKRRLYHMIISFPDNMRSKNAIKKMAENVADLFFSDFQVYYGIHTAKENWHIHVAINAVSYRTGKKWHQNKKELADMKKRIRRLASAINV